MPVTSFSEPTANGVGFSHLECGDSEIDRLMEADGGFRSLGHFVRVALQIQARGNAGTPSDSDREIYRNWVHANSQYRNWLHSHVDKGVDRAISSPDGMYETSDPDGGSLVPMGFVRQVWDKSRFADTPFKRAKTVFTRSNAGVLPTIAETSRVDGSRWGGVLGYWEGEAQQLNKLHGTLAADQFRCKKLTLLIPASDELVEDGGGLFDAYITETAAKELQFQINRTIVNGTGAGVPLGVMSSQSPATILVAKDTGQAAGTISATNVQNMWTQTHGPSRANGVWWANEEFDPDTLALPVTPVTAWGVPVDAPTLKGRPVVPLEWCPTIGSPGDLFFADFSQYLLILRSLGEKMVSMHFKFDVVESYLKFSYRCDGMPLWFSPLTSLYGTKPKSPFVGIAQR